MQIRRRAITVGTTFFLAAATGHVMQNGDTISARLRGAPEKPVLASIESTVATIPATAAASAAPARADSAAAPMVAPSAPRIAASASATPEPVSSAAAPITSGLPDLPTAEPVTLGADLRLAGRVGKLDAGYTRPDTAADAAYSVFGLACSNPALTLDAAARGMLRVTLAAPCFANERVTVTHAGLAFATATDEGGDLDFMLPAMSADAKVDVRFASGDAVSASRRVTGLEVLTRLAVQRRGAEGLHLHALENGAGFDMPGHVSAAAPRDRATGKGGFVTVLGDPGVDNPLMAEIYTAPARMAPAVLVVEAPVTGSNCARLLAGQALRMVPGAAPVREMLNFAMPGCDAVGDSLLLGLAPTPVPPVAMALDGN